MSGELDGCRTPVVFSQVSLNRVDRMIKYIVRVKLSISHGSHVPSFSSHSITRLLHNFQIVFLINCLFWSCVIIMRNTTRLEKDVNITLNCCEPVLFWGVLVMSKAFIVMMEILFPACIHKLMSHHQWWPSSCNQCHC